MSPNMSVDKTAIAHSCRSSRIFKIHITIPFGLLYRIETTNRKWKKKMWSECMAAWKGLSHVVTIYNVTRLFSHLFLCCFFSLIWNLFSFHFCCLCLFIFLCIYYGSVFPCRWDVTVLRLWTFSSIHIEPHSLAPFNPLLWFLLLLLLLFEALIIFKTIELTVG